MSKSARPGRPRANRAVYQLLGRVDAAKDDANIVEASLPVPQNFKTIMGVFRNLFAFELTFEFAPEALHIYGAAASSYAAGPSASATKLLVTLPVEAMCQYFLAGGETVTVGVVRPAVEDCCSNITARHEYVQLSLDARRAHLRVALHIGGLSTVFECTTIPGDIFVPAPLPLEAEACGVFPEEFAAANSDAGEWNSGSLIPNVQSGAEDSDSDCSDTAEFAAANSAAGEFPAGNSGEDGGAPYDCSWQVRNELLNTILAHISGTGVMDRVTFTASDALDGVDYRTPSKAPAAALPTSHVRRPAVQLIMCPEVTLHASYMCNVFAGLKALATAQHRIAFFMDNTRPLVVDGFSLAAASDPLLARAYFRIEAARVD
jgi:hypothetical protein